MNRENVHMLSFNYMQSHLVLIEIQEQRKISPVMILDVKGYYMYGGLPLIKLSFREHDRNSAAIKTIKDTTTVYVKDRGCVRQKSHCSSCIILLMTLMLNICHACALFIY